MYYQLLWIHLPLSLRKVLLANNPRKLNELDLIDIFESTM